MNPLINVKGLTKSFGPKMTALDRVNLQIMPGEMVALIGASGSGKSTLLRHLPGLTAADRNGDSGEISILGSTVQSKGRIASDIRRQRQHIGFIFQQFNLVDRLSVLTNVLVGSLSRVPLQRSMLRMFSPQEKTKALEALDRVGIADWALQKASTLSGGQQQRAAIARALVQEAKIILADEPIASLDPESSRRVMEILANINRVDGITVVVSLHQVEFAVKFCPRIVALKKGRVVFDGPSNTVTNELLSDLYCGDPDVEDPGYCLLPQAAGTMAA